MFNYLFPIFAFGLVMTAIVFLGLQQAADLAKNLTAERSEKEKGAKIPETGSLGRNAAPAQKLISTSRP